MVKQDSWKRTDEIEIDLADLLKKLCGQWMRIAVCGLAAAVITGEIGWIREKNISDKDVSGVQEELVLTEEEEQEVEEAVLLENETKALKLYLDNSILMQIDPYHKTKHTMLYSVSQAEWQELQAVTESYLNYIWNGGAVDSLLGEGNWKMDKSCFLEMISAYQKTYSFPYQILVDSLKDKSMVPKAIFYIEVTGRNSREAEKLAMDIQGVLKEYSEKVTKTVGSHRLELLSSMAGTVSDSGLQAQQREKKALLSANLAGLKAKTDAFSREQTKIYQEAVSETGTDDMQQAVSDKSVLDESVSGESFSPFLKYALLGALAGIFLYACIFSMMYMFSDTVKSIDEIKRMYFFPVFGEIKPAAIGSKRDTDAFGRTEEQVLNRIRLACKRQGVVKLAAAADFPLERMEKECLENMASQLKHWGIDMELEESISTDISTWDRLMENGNVLLICRIGTTTHRMLDNIGRFFGENNVNTAGAAVFCRMDKNQGRDAF